MLAITSTYVVESHKSVTYGSSNQHFQIDESNANETVALSGTNAHGIQGNLLTFRMDQPMRWNDGRVCHVQLGTACLERTT